jgi:hypothetical protein
MKYIQTIGIGRSMPNKELQSTMEAKCFSQHSIEMHCLQFGTTSNHFQMKPIQGSDIGRSTPDKGLQPTQEP